MRDFFFIYIIQFSAALCNGFVRPIETHTRIDGFDAAVRIRTRRRSKQPIVSNRLNALTNKFVDENVDNQGEYLNRSIDFSSTKSVSTSPSLVPGTVSTPSGQQIELIFNDNDNFDTEGFVDLSSSGVEHSSSTKIQLDDDSTIHRRHDDDRNVHAVLAASEVAAAHAEATLLSSDVAEQLENEISTIESGNFELLEPSTGSNGQINDTNQHQQISSIIPPTVDTTSTTVSPTGAIHVDEDFPASNFHNGKAEEIRVAIEPDVQNQALADHSLTTTTPENGSNQQNEPLQHREPIDLATPSVAKILKFAIPAIGVWLCSPLLSLIDTSAVGVLSGTTNQAALNPAVAITDYAALCIAFLYTGTTNMVAAAHSKDDKSRTSKMMVGAMQMSTYVGGLLGAVLFVFARPLLTAIIGNDGISPAVFAAAKKYVRIRALGMPAAAVIGSTQAACLGMKDIRSPLYVLVAAAVVNLIGDVFFVGQSNPWIGGATGAAWATVMSQYAALTLFFQWLRTKPKITKDVEKKSSSSSPEILNLSESILDLTSTPNRKGGRKRQKRLRNIMEKLNDGGNSGQESGLKKSSPSSKLFRRRSGNNVIKKKDDSFSSRGFLKNRLSLVDLMRFPDKETRKEFAPYVLPVTSTQVGRVSGYVAMSHVVASSLGTASMAAQQVIVSIFYCLCPIADSLSLTAQSFVPPISEREPSIEKAKSLRKTLVNFLKAGSVFGGAMMAAVSAIPLLSGLFTTDKVVIQLVNSVIPHLLLFFGLHGCLMGSEGMLLGQKDLGFLGKLYAAFFFIVPYAMVQVKRAALAGKSVGIQHVWSIFGGYQIARIFIWIGRTFVIQRRTENEVKNAVAL